MKKINHSPIRLSINFFSTEDDRKCKELLADFVTKRNTQFYKAYRT